MYIYVCVCYLYIYVTINVYKYKCDLCLTEKMIIARSDPKKLLNKRTELICKCRHRNKFLLSNIK